MFRIALTIISVLLLFSLAFGGSLNLRATWNPNTETDMASYKLYRVDTGRILIGTISHPPALPYLFSVSVADNSQGSLSFVLTAVDTSGNESADSNSVVYPFDLKAPAAPSGFGVSKQGP
jgi:hypothetical protein